MNCVCRLILIAILFPSAIAAREPVRLQYHTHKFPKPADYRSLQHLNRWISENWHEGIVSETLIRNDGREVLVFYEVGRETEPSFLFEEADLLVLITTAKLDLREYGDVMRRDFDNAVSRCDTTVNRRNCVLFARCLIPSLPLGLHSRRDKVGIINLYTPSIGSVAVISRRTSAGHLAVVVDIDTNGRVTIVEGNYNGRVNNRAGMPAELGIDGYFRPQPTPVP